MACPLNRDVRGCRACCTARTGSEISPQGSSFPIGQPAGQLQLPAANSRSCSQITTPCHICGSMHTVAGCLQAQAALQHHPHGSALEAQVLGLWHRHARSKFGVEEFINDEKWRKHLVQAYHKLVQVYCRAPGWGPVLLPDSAALQYTCTHHTTVPPCWHACHMVGRPEPMLTRQ